MPTKRFATSANQRKRQRFLRTTFLQSAGVFKRAGCPQSSPLVSLIFPPDFRSRTAPSDRLPTVRALAWDRGDGIG